MIKDRVKKLEVRIEAVGQNIIPESLIIIRTHNHSLDDCIAIQAQNLGVSQERLQETINTEKTKLFIIGLADVD